jgi:hypothetical protein
MRSAMGRLALWVWVFASAAFACGARTPIDDETDASSQTAVATTGMGSGDDEAAPGSLGDDSSFVDFGVCPPGLPETETPCNVPGTACVYGRGLPSCQGFLCNVAGFWQATTQGC